MISRLMMVLVCIIFSGIQLLSQETDTTALEKPWSINLSLGTDISQLLQINPKVGAGENRFGIGWVINTNADYKKERLAWDTDLIWNFSIQRLGEGLLVGSEESVPFQKSIDEIRLKSKLGYKFKKESKFFYALDFSFLSQITRTYDGNYLKDIKNPEVDDHPISRFLSPAQTTFSIGIDYKPNKKFSFFLSPLGYKSIMVLDDEIANDVVTNNQGIITGSVHGNPVTLSEDKTTLLGFKNIRHEMGALFRAIYQNKFKKGKIKLKSGLVMYSNYLDTPSRVDYEWTTETNIQILNGLNLSLLTILFYDYDVFAYRSNSNLEDGVNQTPERDLISFTQQLVIKYNVSF
ncbi:MAG: DUF3078 domain-containing protein [Saprospiraceae bacterium]|nr:DUF3078 domain-containing protein [Saprospiraceae bacterium]